MASELSDAEAKTLQDEIDKLESQLAAAKAKLPLGKRQPPIPSNGTFFAPYLRIHVTNRV